MIRPGSLCLALLVLAGAPVRAGDPLRVLDVPYVTQPQQLCGGAAATMVLRYWGDRDAAPRQFASLVDVRLAGIRTDSLRAALDRRGWRTVPLDGTLATLRHHLARGRPPIVLLGRQDGGHHYVVVVGWGDDVVVLHDPAVGAFRTVPLDAFEARWQRGDRWALLVVPGPGQPPRDATEATNPVPARPNRPWSHVLADAVAAGERDDLTTAAGLLTDAAARWPDAAAIERELAGVRFRQRRFQEAADHAAAAVRRDRDDSHAWRILAASRFLLDDPVGALDAWRRAGRSRLGVVEVGGVERMHATVVRGQLAAPLGEPIRGRDLVLARRRLAALPAVERVQVDLLPVSGGGVDLAAHLVERPSLIDRARAPAWIARAVVDREIGLRWVSPAGGGEVYRASWRWWPNRPRVRLGVAVPGLLGVPGVICMTFTGEEQTYGSPAVRTHRRRSALAWEHWLAAPFRLALGTAADRWRDRGTHAAVSLAATVRPATDRWSFTGRAESWSSLQRRSPFATASLALHGRLLERGEVAITAGAGVRWASARAPADVWPAAGALATRGVPLRAHPLLDDGVITGRHLGHRLAHATVDARRWLLRLGPWHLGVAAALDAVHLGDAGWTADASAGVRLAGLDDRRQLRLDVGRGLTDGATALSLAWQEAWPR